MSHPIADYVAAASPATPRLPLVHGTDIYHFKAIVECNALTPTPCDVFKQDLVYLFYGRPSYRVGVRSEARRDQLYNPACIVFKPDLPAKIARVFPFDTGAFHAGLYKAFLHHSMTLADFEVGNSSDSPAQIVAAFFGTNDRYYKGQLVPPSVAISAFEVQVYYDMVGSTGASATDDRASTIEIQTADAISISGNVLGVVLPTPAMDNPAIANLILKVWNVPYLTYHAFTKSRPSEYHGLVVEKVYDLLKRAGLV